MAPKIYHMHPLVAGPLAEWSRHLARCHAMGFDFVGSAPMFAPGRDGDIFLSPDHEALHPALGWDGPADAGIAGLAEDCARHDPHHVQEAGIEIPLWEWGLPDSGALAAEDLVRNHRFTWIGKNQTMRLDPGEMPFCIWRIGPVGAVA